MRTFSKTPISCRPHSISYNAVKELYGSFANVKFIGALPAAAPLKSDWRENVFWMSGGEEIFSKVVKYFPDFSLFLSSGEEDRVQYWQARWATGQSQWNSEQPHQYLLKVSQPRNLATPPSSCLLPKF